MLASRVWPWAVILAAAPFALYALHRLALWLEARGHLYYWHRKPGGGGSANVLTPLQEVIDPPAKHVRLVREQRRSRSEEGEPGGEDTPG